VRWSRLAPDALSAARLTLAPVVYLEVAARNFTVALALLAFAVVTDVLDGALARRLKASSARGAYLDAVADFAVLLSAFVALVGIGVCPPWLPAVIVAMFAQFVLTSRRGGLVYDPVGKHSGSLLYAVAALTLALPDAALCGVLERAVIGLSLVSVVSRALTLANPASRVRVDSREV
jgi:phosphatidylglycerophosphate synthase